MADRKKRHNFVYRNDQDGDLNGAHATKTSNQDSSQNDASVNQFTDHSLERRAREADQLDQIGNDLLLNLKDQLNQMKQANDDNNRALYDQFLDQNLESKSSFFQNSRKEGLSQKSPNVISPTFNKDTFNIFDNQIAA